MKAGSALLAGVAIVVVAAIAASLVVMGPPSAQRDRRLDEVRVQDLAGLERRIDAYAQSHDGLPSDLAALTQGNAPLKATDPKTGEAYGYERVDDRRYRLCATFSASSAEGNGYDLSWPHGAGRACFERRARIGPR